MKINGDMIHLYYSNASFELTLEEILIHGFNKYFKKNNEENFECNPEKFKNQLNFLKMLRVNVKGKSYNKHDLKKIIKLKDYNEFTFNVIFLSGKHEDKFTEEDIKKFSNINFSIYV